MVDRGGRLSRGNVWSSGLRWFGRYAPSTQNYGEDEKCERQQCGDERCEQCLQFAAARGVTVNKNRRKDYRRDRQQDRRGDQQSRLRTRQRLDREDAKHECYAGTGTHNGGKRRRGEHKL